jgi:hypothetical protein
MRDWLFSFVNELGGSFATGCQILASFLIKIIEFTFNTIIQCIAYLFKFVLYLIDKERVNHAEQVFQQASINNELQILINATKVKEDALARGVWGNEHSIALNELSSELYYECNWGKDRIHSYMRSIVESIPGLSYVAGDEDDDEDAISLDR